MVKFGKYFLILLAIFIAAFVFTYYPYDKFDQERREMTKVTSEFLETVKQNDTAKARDKLFYGILLNDYEGFTWNIKLASEVLNKYGLPENDKISLDSSVHNVPTTICVVYSLHTAINQEDDLQKAEIDVCIQKINGKYRVVEFFNDFLYKATPIEQ